MHDLDKIVKSYNATAESYAATRIDELSGKHLDRLLLKEFAMVNKDKGLCADFGCGPGQVTKYLYDQGVKEIMGIDISAEMVKSAHRYFPDIDFTTGNLLELAYPSGYFASAVAFYAIVNFDFGQIGTAFTQINKVLKNGAQFLFSFHVGHDLIHFDKANEIDVDIDMYFWQTQDILKLLRENNFTVIDALEREPYLHVEYASRRGYVLAEKKHDFYATC